VLALRHQQRENSGVVVGGSGPGDDPITALGRRLPPSNLVLYDLFIDDFTDEYRTGRAPVDAVVDKLDRLVELGFNAIEIMPWTHGWPRLQLGVHALPVSLRGISLRPRASGRARGTLPG
jgi:hypothetical protein